MALIWLNGRLVPPEEATISVLDRGLLNGQGLFETLRAYDGRPWAVADHIERLQAGAPVIDLPLPAEPLLEEALLDTVQANDLSEAGVRLTITRGSGPVDVQSDAETEPNVFVVAWPVRDYTQLYADGAVIVTFQEGGRALAHVKSTSYAMSVAGRVFARRAGADDAIFTVDGRVLEATGSNVFAVDGERITTPPLGEGILPGVTRRHVIALARDAGFDVVEEPITLDQLVASEEVFLTSSLREVYPARSIDGVVLKRRGVAELLREAFGELVVSASRG